MLKPLTNSIAAVKDVAHDVCVNLSQKDITITPIKKFLIYTLTTLVYPIAKIIGTENVKKLNARITPTQ